MVWARLEGAITARAKATAATRHRCISQSIMGKRAIYSRKMTVMLQFGGPRASGKKLFAGSGPIGFCLGENCVSTLHVLEHGFRAGLLAPGKSAGSKRFPGAACRMSATLRCRIGDRPAQSFMHHDVVQIAQSILQPLQACQE